MILEVFSQPECFCDSMILSPGCRPVASGDTEPALPGQHHGTALAAAGHPTCKISWSPPPSLFLHSSV